MRTERPRLGEWIAATLRVGTLLTMVLIGIGLAVALLTGEPARGARPLAESLAGGGADALITAGLLGLTLIPVAALGVAATAFARAGERGRLLTTLVALGLLVASLAAAATLVRPI